MTNNLITVISIGIVIVSLLIVFNIVGITNAVNNPTTGFAISEQEDEEGMQETPEKPAKILDEEQVELYSEQAYGLFYFILIILIVVIVGIGLTMILPRVKRYT